MPFSSRVSLATIWAQVPPSSGYGEPLSKHLLARLGAIGLVEALPVHRAIG